MVVDGNCGFRAVVHIIHGQESVWHEVCQRFLDQLNSDPTGYLRDFAITSSAEISAEPAGEPDALFGPIWDRNKWFDSDKHARLTADAYDIFVMMVTYDYSNVVIRVPISFQSAEAIRATIPIARLLGLLFSDCGGAGHWNSIDIERTRELLDKRGYAGVCVGIFG